MDPAAQTMQAAQQAAIQEARARYERGELSYETFRRALDALVLAQNADECQVILRELPTAPLAPLNALDTPVSVPVPAPRRKRFVAFMSQVKKRRRPWRLEPESLALAFMGEVKLDLGTAELPPHAKLQITAIMGTVHIYVPRGVHVSVRSMVLLGDMNALGEGVTGVIGFGHEEHIPTPEPALAQLEIEAFVLMSNVKVILTNGPIVSIKEIVGDALRAVADGVRRGLQSPSAPGWSTALGSGDAREAERMRAARQMEAPRGGADTTDTTWR